MSSCRILILSAAMAAGCTTNAHVSSPKDLLITDVRIVSAERGAPSESLDVLVHNGIIEKIASDLSESVTNVQHTIAGDGRFLAPGLIDGHTHLDEVPGMTFDHERDNPEIARAAREQIPKSYLYYGFTTVVDLNGRADTIAAWNNRAVRPQAYFCGAAPLFDGYPMSWMPKPARYQIMPYFLFDEARADEFPQGFDPADHSPAAVVSRMQNDGAICVKTHFEPGFGGRGDLPTPTVKNIRDLIAAAHQKGMPLLLHANSQKAQSFGVEAGVDAFAHGAWTWDDRAVTALNEPMTLVLDKIIENEIAWQPTIQVLYGERDLHDPDYLSNPILRATTPQSLLDWHRTEAGQWWRRRMMNIPFVAELVDAGRWRELDGEPIARVKAALGYLASHDAHLIFGSDTPSDPTYANPPGLNGRLEFDNWMAAGAAPAQLFRAATLSNAEFFGLDKEIGTVEEGKRADLLLLGMNPIADVAAYDSIELVVAAGKVYLRSELASKANE